jgi:hypothetical protein
MCLQCGSGQRVNLFVYILRCFCCFGCLVVLVLVLVVVQGVVGIVICCWDEWEERVYAKDSRLQA